MTVADDKDKPPPKKKPYVDPINNLTQEQWERAMRRGQEDSADQSASLRRDLEIYEQNKKLKDQERKDNKTE
jgi:hypothetical protein